MADSITHTAGSTATTVTVRGLDLCADVIGHLGFTELLYYLTCRRMPTAGERTLVDACLVTLMEHGLNPSTLIARLAAHSVPDEPQVAIAAGLLAVGSVYAGTTEDCAVLLQVLAAAERAGRLDAEIAANLQRFRAARQPVPGFGHGTHKPDDPRALRLVAVARASGVATPHVDLLAKLATAVDAQAGRHITINATGAIAALLLDAGVPLDAIRGYAVVARSAGLIGHLQEERATQSARTIWDAARAAIPYADPE